MADAYPKRVELLVRPFVTTKLEPSSILIPKYLPWVMTDEKNVRT